MLYWTTNPMTFTLKPFPSDLLPHLTADESAHLTALEEDIRRLTSDYRYAFRGRRQLYNIARSRKVRAS